MSETSTIAAIRTMAAGLLEHPLLDPTPTTELRKRIQRRHRRRAFEIGGCTLIIAVAIALLVTSLPIANDDHPSIRPSVNLASFVRTSVAVPDSVLEAVGHPSVATPLIAIHRQPSLTDEGKPVLVYVGSGACPSCAYQQWALLVALSRFGSFSNLGQFVIPPSTSGPPLPLSWSFAGSTYTSSVLNFEPAEVSPLATTGPNGNVLPPQAMNRLQRKAIDRLEGGSSVTQSFPFTDIANRFWDHGFAVRPSNTWYTLLQGLSLDQVAADLSHPSSPVAQVIDGAANYMIGDICAVAGKKSAPICFYDTKT